MRVKTLTALVLLLFGLSAGWNAPSVRSQADSVSPDGSASFRLSSPIAWRASA